MAKTLCCFFLFMITVYMCSIDQTLKSDQQKPIVVQVTPDIARIDSLNNVLMNKVIEQEEIYNRRIDSLSRSMRRIQHDYERIRKYSTMIP